MCDTHTTDGTGSAETLQNKSNITVYKNSFSWGSAWTKNTNME